MPGGSRNRTASWWDTENPVTGPTGTAGTIRGNRLVFLEAGRVFGMRYYSRANDANQSVALFCDFEALDNALLATRQFVNPPGNESARWRNCWFHPALRIETEHEYEALVFYPVGGYFRTIDRLSANADHINNGMDFITGVVLGSLNFVSASRTVTNDGYAVDVLFRPDNYVPLAYP
jgi:hypothetical protein